MDLSATMTSTQLLLAWTLFSLLFIWLFVFTFLALQPAAKRVEEPEELAAPDHPLPARAVSLQLQKTSPAAESLSYEATPEAGAVQVR